MPPCVYLDTARMGRISPTARAIHIDYLKFAAQQGGSEAMLDLLVGGGQAWPRRLRKRFPVLAGWEGVSGLKQRLRRVAGVNGADLSNVLFASRSRTLMRLAAQLLFRSCSTVVTADVGWPPYQLLLRDVGAELGGRVVEVPLLEMIRKGAGGGAIVDRLTAAFGRSQAAGLFLPSISHDGIRLPVRAIIDALAAMGRLPFVAIDGAQDLAHGDWALAEMNCDFYFAGAHKWLRGCFPLGVGLWGQPRSRQMIAATIEESGETGLLEDPLARFTFQLEGGALDGVTETVNLSALLSAHGAMVDVLRLPPRGETFAVQLANREAIRRVARRAGWEVVATNPELRCGIVMLRSPVIAAHDGDLRRQLERQGVVATAYPTGEVRLSMPRRILGLQELATVGRALATARIHRGQRAGHDLLNRQAP